MLKRCDHPVNLRFSQGVIGAISREDQGLSVKFVD
jgi:hypothetical protein